MDALPTALHPSHAILLGGSFHRQAAALVKVGRHRCHARPFDLQRHAHRRRICEAGTLGPLEAASGKPAIRPSLVSRVPK